MQLRNLLLFAACLYAGSVTLVVLYFGAHAGSGLSLGAGIGLGISALIASLVLAGLWRGFTECSPAGIRTRGLGGEHKRGWADVTEIAVRHSGGPSPLIRGARTLSVTVVTRSGARFTLGAPISGGVASDAGFEAKARQIRDYWRSAIGAADELDPSAPLPRDYVPPDRPPAIDFAAVAVLLVLGAVVAAPIALARSGPALLAWLGRGQLGSFTAYGRMCTSACYWIGEFTARHGARRDGMLMAQHGAGTHPGGPVAAVFAGNAPLTYPAAGGTAWIPPATTVAILIFCLPVAAFAIARYRRQLSDLRQGRNPLRGRQLLRQQRLAADPSTMVAKIKRRSLIAVIIILVVVVGEWAGLAAALSATPMPPPSPAQIACADYISWDPTQNPGGPPGSEPAALARALREAPAGSPLSAELAALSADVQTAIAENGTQAGVLAEMSVANDMGRVTKDCSAADY